LFATEVMAHHRMIKMGEGLERLSFDNEDREFIRVHVECAKAMRPIGATA
jgi:hypothetical protein